ncbi:MAG TPA: TerC family protein [Polyangia bacterium]|nr:TerC family protein [Polyangia bacterium]
MFDLRALLSVEGLLGLASLAVMEIVLGIDNILLVAILSQRVARARRKRVRRLGIGLALILRIALLFGLTWLMGLTKPLFTLMDHGFSGRDLVLLAGGLFLMFKATTELYDRIERSPGDDDLDGDERKAAGSVATVAQILALDVVFSLDSVITAVGMARALPVMVLAMIIAVGVMFIFANVVAEFINRHPSMKILALAFLLLIGVLLVADAFGHHINRGYVYFAMAFSLLVELMNMRFRKKTRAKRPSI